MKKQLIDICESLSRHHYFINNISNVCSQITKHLDNPTDMINITFVEDLLKSIEFRIVLPIGSCCPYCGNLRSVGHNQNCELYTVMLSLDLVDADYTVCKVIHKVPHCVAPVGTYDNKSHYRFESYVAVLKKSVTDYEPLYEFLNTYPLNRKTSIGDIIYNVKSNTYVIVEPVGFRTLSVSEIDNIPYLE